METISNSKNAETFEEIKEIFSDVYCFNCDDNKVDEFKDAKEIRAFCVESMKNLTIMIDKLRRTQNGTNR